MANGAAALHLALAPCSRVGEHLRGRAQQAHQDCTGGSGRAAVFVLYRAVLDRQENDALAPTTIAAGGSRIAKLAELQLDYAGGDTGFVTQAHRDGKRELRRCFSNTDLFRQHDPVEIDNVFDTSISDVLGIVGKVVKDEGISRAAWAN